MELKVRPRNEGLFDRSGILRHTSLSMGESRTWDDNVCDTAECSEGNLEVKDLSRQMGNKWIGRGQVNPRASKCYELADYVGRTEGCIKIVQCRYQGQRLRWRLGKGLRVRVEDAEDTVMEVVICDWAREHIILAMISRGSCIFSAAPTPRSWACWTSSGDTSRLRFDSCWPI